MKSVQTPQPTGHFQFKDQVLANRVRRAHARRNQGNQGPKVPLASIARDLLIEYVTMLERSDPATTVQK